MEKKDKSLSLIDKIEKENKIINTIFTVDLPPEPYARPRTSIKLFRATGKNLMYNPRIGYIKKIKKNLSEKIGNDTSIFPVSGPVECSIVFYITPPKDISTSKTKIDLINKNIIYPQTRPDIDNYLKPVLDAMQNIIYKDDAQIFKISGEKRYSTEEDGREYFIIDLKFRKDKIKLVNRKGASK